MMAIELSQEQRAVVDAPFERCVAVVGAHGTGKTRALLERAARAREQLAPASPLTFASPREIDRFAFALLAERGAAVCEVDDVDAEALFLAACEPLLALEWEEFAAELDPEVPGLRSPQRFVESAFRLFRRLREALVTPDEFLARSLAGATEFAAKPPNFADPALLFATKNEHHDSLAVTPQELQRQYRREVDLAKILARLYAEYEALVAATGRMTGRDAVALAVAALRDDPAAAARLRERAGAAFVDGADELTPGRLALLQALFGRELAGVTLAATDYPAGLGEPLRIELRQQYRSPLAIELACHLLLKTPHRLEAAGAEPALELARVRTPRDEAALVAERVEEWLQRGTPPERIAVLMRSVRHAGLYEAALLDRNVPTIRCGDVNVFEDRRALDALALLFNVDDPFRHDWLLRTLGNAAFALSDASLSLLCSEPPHPQAALFVLDDERAPTVRSSRWDPKRDLRLGWNVVRGEQDAELSESARETIGRFRALRDGWLGAMQTLPFDEFVRRVWREGLAREGAPGSARALAQQAVLQRLLARLLDFRAIDPDATLATVLARAERRAESDLESCEDDAGSGFVRLMSVDAAAGMEFDRVAIADVRAGAFPRWYVPDAFLFSPRAGMIPKENAGEARSARTAKFTYYLHRNKTRDRYNDRERRAFVGALRRARTSALVTAWGSPTRGVTAPEFLEELRNAHLPGSVVS